MAREPMLFNGLDWKTSGSNNVIQFGGCTSNAENSVYKTVSSK